MDESAFPDEARGKLGVVEMKGLALVVVQIGGIGGEIGLATPER